MKKQLLGIVIIVLTLSFGAVSALACKAAGLHKHVGPITSIDNNSGTFTILDAQTNKPISFTASKKLLNEAAKAKGNITVDFKSDDKGNLTAKEIQ